MGTTRATQLLQKLLHEVEEDMATLHRVHSEGTPKREDPRFPTQNKRRCAVGRTLFNGGAVS